MNLRLHTHYVSRTIFTYYGPLYQEDTVFLYAFCSLNLQNTNELKTKKFLLQSNLPKKPYSVKDLPIVIIGGIYIKYS